MKIQFHLIYTLKHYLGFILKRNRNKHWTMGGETSSSAHCSLLRT